MPSGKGNVHTLQRPTPIYASRLTKINCDSALPCRKSPCLSPRYVIDNIFQASQSACELQLRQSQQYHVPTCSSSPPISSHLHDHGDTLSLQFVGHTPRSRLAAAGIQLALCSSSCTNTDAIAPSRNLEDHNRKSSGNRLRSRLAVRRAQSVFLRSIQLDFQTLSGKPIICIGKVYPITE